MKRIEDFLAATDEEIIYKLDELKCLTDGLNYWYIDNGYDICVVCHIDTVRSNDNIKLHKKGNVLTNVCGILGADDRAGVYMMFKMMREGVKANFLFTNFEESGGRGVQRFIKDLPTTCSNIKFFMELDRQGIGEYVVYNDFPESYRNILGTFGLKESYGSYSDIADLSEHYLAPSFNLSVGYYNQHSREESLDIKHMNYMYDVAINIIEKADAFPKERISKWGQEDKWNDLDDSFYSGSYNDLDDSFYSGSYNDFCRDGADDLIYRAIEVMSEELLVCMSGDHIFGIAEKAKNFIRKELLKTF